MAEPFGVLRHQVKTVSVHHEQTPAVSRFMDELIAHLDAAELQQREVTHELPQELVVVSRHVVDARSLLQQTQHLAQNQIAFVSPIPAPLEFPTIDEIANDVERLEARVPLDLLEKVQQVDPSWRGGFPDERRK